MPGLLTAASAMAGWLLLGLVSVQLPAELPFQDEPPPDEVIIETVSEDPPIGPEDLEPPETAPPAPTTAPPATATTSASPTTAAPPSAVSSTRRTTTTPRPTTTAPTTTAPSGDSTSGGAQPVPERLAFAVEEEGFPYGYPLAAVTVAALLIALATVASRRDPSA